MYINLNCKTAVRKNQGLGVSIRVEKNFRIQGDEINCIEFAEVCEFSIMGIGAGKSHNPSKLHPLMLLMLFPIPPVYPVQITYSIFHATA